MDLPPVFDAHPAVQLIRWIRDPFGLLEEGQARFGDTFTLRLPPLSTPMVLLASPESVRDVFALDADEAHCGEANAVLKPVFGERSLFLLDGPTHTRHRKLLQPAFHGERMHAYGHAMLEAAHEAVDWMPLGQSFSLLRAMQGVTMEIMLRNVFGLQPGPRSVELALNLTRMLDAGTRPSRIVAALLMRPLLEYDVVRRSPLGRLAGLATRAEMIIREEIHQGRRQGTGGGPTSSPRCSRLATRRARA